MGALTGALGAVAGATPPPRTIGHLSFLGEARLAPGTQLEATEVGGLSSLLWDETTGSYYAISDDPSSKAPARFYTLAIDLSNGRLSEGAVTVTGVTLFTNESGATFPELEIDGESLALLPDRTLLVGSEGNLRRGVLPSLLQFDLEGHLLRRFELPERYLPEPTSAAATEGETPTRGVRHNQVFEGIAVTPDGRSFFTGLEGPLLQDAPNADVGVPSWLRIARWDVSSGAITGEYVYPLEPVPEPPSEPDGFRINGLAELAALADGRLLVIERAYSQGVGNTVRLFVADPRSATDVQDRSALAGALSGIRPIAKRLLVDLVELDRPLDNLEGLTFGPALPGGRRALLLSSDNNFDDVHQFTQFLAFAVAEATPSIPQIQGAAHRSPLEGDWVYGVMGTVTAVDAKRGFWIQDGGDGVATSDGLFVTGEGAGDLAPGDAVRVNGRVIEVGRSGNLPVTTLAAYSWDVDARGRPLPAPVRLIHEPALPAGGETMGEITARVLPGTVVDDDGLASFDPTSDGADFWESLEGMRVSIHRPLVIGPTTRYGGIGVLAEGGQGAGPRTHRGGLRLSEGDLNPERILLSSRISAKPPSATIGDVFTQPITGVVDHDFGHYRVVVSEPLPALEPGGLPPEQTTLAATAGTLRVATCNALNLGGNAGEERMERLAREIVEALGAPDLVALEEIQDDSGATDDGTVGAELTLGRLTAAIVAAGGPAYAWLQIDPLDGMDGGQPGGNIRVALLFDPRRFDLERRPIPDTSLPATDRPVAALDTSGGALHLAVNPALIAPDDPAFEHSRKPLVAELTLDGAPFFVVALHLASKGGDDPVFGVRQPPVLGSEAQRREQAARVGEFAAALLATDPQARLVVLGDLNEHDFRAPVRALVDRGLVNLVTGLPEDDRYSFNYEANSQILDHVLVSPSLAAGAELDIVHMNADYPFDRQTSDHDPLVARLPLP